MLDIFQGERQAWSMQITTKNQVTGKTSPLDLTGFNEITVCFRTDANILIKLESTAGVTVDSLLQGEISGFLSVADTNAMPGDKTGDTEVAVDFGGGDVKKTQILRSHKVTAKFK